MGWRWMVGWGVLGNGMSRQYCPGCVYWRLGSQNGPSSSFSSNDEVPLFPFGALFILWNFKWCLLSFFKFSSVLQPICFLMIQIWTKMKRWTFPPPSSATDKQKLKPLSSMLFVCFCFWQISAVWFREGNKLMQAVQQYIFKELQRVRLSTHWSCNVRQWRCYQL